MAGGNVAPPFITMYAVGDNGRMGVFMQAKDVMKTNVISVFPETTVIEIAKLLVDNSVSGVPVVTKHREILGVVSEESLLYKLAKPDQPGFAAYFFHGVFHSEEVAKYQKAMQQWKAATAEEIMTAPAICVDVNDDIEKASKLMLDNRIKRVFVTDERFLAGVISRSDLVRIFLERAQKDTE